MNKILINWQIAGFAFTVMIGTLFHFLYDFTGGNVLAALISPVNESIWEHIKLIFFPMVFFEIIEYYFYGNAFEQFWCVKLKGVLLAMVLIPVLYYTYTGIIGKSFDWLNIVIFFVTAAISYLVETRMFLNRRECQLQSWVVFAVIVVIALLFFVFTFYPPHIPFFQDPMTGTYAKSCFR